MNYRTCEKCAFPKYDCRCCVDRYEDGEHGREDLLAEIKRLHDVIYKGGAAYRAERSVMGIAGGIDPHIERELYEATKAYLDLEFYEEPEIHPEYDRLKAAVDAFSQSAAGQSVIGGRTMLDAGCPDNIQMKLLHISDQWRKQQFMNVLCVLHELVGLAIKEFASILARPPVV